MKFVFIRHFYQHKIFRSVLSIVEVTEANWLKGTDLLYTWGSIISLPLLQHDFEIFFLYCMRMTVEK